MLCVPLWVDERCLGALSLYADQAAAFTDLHGRVTTLLATFAALALASCDPARENGLVVRSGPYLRARGSIA